MQLEDLGLIGNCQFSALIHNSGEIVWCCLRRFDSEPVFSTLLDLSVSAGARNFMKIPTTFRPSSTPCGFSNLRGVFDPVLRKNSDQAHRRVKSRS